MELYQLRAFVAVAEEGNVTRAAERLFSSQPAVSGQLKALEGSLGVSLFTRTPAGMALTEAGRRLLHEARETLARAQRVEDLAKHLKDGTAGTLRVGLNCPVARLRAGELTRALVARCPDLQVHLSTGPSGEIVRQLKRYDLDAGFIEGPVPAGLRAHRLGDNRVCIVAPRAWAEELAGEDWSALQHRPWVFASPDCSYFRLFEKVCSEHDVSLPRQFRTDEEGTTLQFVRSGLAMSLADRVTADAAAAAGEVWVWPHFEAQLAHHAVALERRAGEPAVEAFFDACAAVYGPGDAPRLAVAG